MDPTRPCPACRRTARQRVYSDGSTSPEWSCLGGHRFTIGNPKAARCRCPTGPFGPRRKAAECVLTSVGPFLVCGEHGTSVWPNDGSCPVELCPDGKATWGRVLASFALEPILHDGPQGDEVPFGYTETEWAAVRPEPAPERVPAPPPPPPVVTLRADDEPMPAPTLFPLAEVPVEVKRKHIGALSPSSADVLDQCPRRFELSKVLGRPEPPSTPATLGKFVHKVLELLTALPLAERTEDKARAIAARLWCDVNRDPGEPVEFDEADEDGSVEELRRDRVALLRDVGADAARWVSRFKGQSWAALAYAVSIEEAYGGEVAYRELRLWDTTVGGVPFRGYADRVDRHRDLDGVFIVDYKSGAPPIDKRSGRIDHAKLDKKGEQLLLYGPPVEQVTGERVIGALLAYIGEAGRVVLWVDDTRRQAAEEKLQRLWANLQRFEADAVAKDRPYPTNPGYLCGWCPHFEDCPQGSKFLLDNWDWVQRREAKGEPVPAAVLVGGWGRDRRDRWWEQARAAS